MTRPHSQPDNASLLAKIARLEQTIDTLENNARVQAKLLADRNPAMTSATASSMLSEHPRGSGHERD